MAEHRTVAPNEDPVCGMTVKLDEARGKGLTTEHEAWQPHKRRLAHEARTDSA